jgi:hypothetical protein
VSSLQQLAILASSRGTPHFKKKRNEIASFRKKEKKSPHFCLQRTTWNTGQRLLHDTGQLSQLRSAPGVSDFVLLY